MEHYDDIPDHLRSFVAGGEVNFTVEQWWQGGGLELDPEACVPAYVYAGDVARDIEAYRRTSTQFTAPKIQDAVLEQAVVDTLGDADAMMSMARVRVAIARISAETKTPPKRVSVYDLFEWILEHASA